MVSYSSIVASVNLMTTSLSDSYHDLVWYHVTTVARSYEAELIDDQEIHGWVVVRDEQTTDFANLPLDVVEQMDGGLNESL